jgi:hypothetical protein
MFFSLELKMNQIDLESNLCNIDYSVLQGTKPDTRKIALGLLIGLMVPIVNNDLRLNKLSNYWEANIQRKVIKSLKNISTTTFPVNEYAISNIAKNVFISRATTDNGSLVALLEYNSTINEYTRYLREFMLKQTGMNISIYDCSLQTYEQQFSSIQELLFDINRSYIEDTNSDTDLPEMLFKQFYKTHLLLVRNIIQLPTCIEESEFEQYTDIFSCLGYPFIKGTNLLGLIIDNYLPNTLTSEIVHKLELASINSIFDRIDTIKRAVEYNIIYSFIESNLKMELK